MAARENQGLQIALIIFVMLTIVLIVTTFLFFRNYRDEQEKSKALVADNAQKDTAARTAIDESAQYKTLIGAAATDNKDAIAAASKKDVDVHGKSLPEGEQNYRALVKFLATELAGANTRIAEITAREKELAEKIKADEEAKAAEIAEYKKTIATTTKDLETERQKFGRDRKELTDKDSKLAKQFDDKRKEFDDLSKQSSEQISGLTTDNTKLTSLLKAKNDADIAGQKSNEVPDGKITWVNQRSRVVWINLGSADGLHLQTSFSVYDSDSTNPADADSKGKLEVVRLMQPHMAEARIVDDNLSNPLMPGDHIFSPAWEPGQPEHFALAGIIDIDGDGENDLERLHDLIALNGGVVDAEVTADGKRTGQMSINTKYLVKGTQPKLGASEKDSNISAYSDLIGEAQTLGVKTIRVKDFLDYMGYKTEDRTVTLGRKAKSADFKPRAPEVQRIMPGGSTRDLRKPAAKSGKSAY